MAELGAELGGLGPGAAEAMRWAAVGLLAVAGAAVAVLPALAAVYEAYAPAGGGAQRGGARARARGGTAAARASVVLSGLGPGGRPASRLHPPAALKV